MREPKLRDIRPDLTDRILFMEGEIKETEMRLQALQETRVRTIQTFRDEGENWPSSTEHTEFLRVRE